MKPQRKPRRHVAGLVHSYIPWVAKHWPDAKADDIAHYVWKNTQPPTPLSTPYAPTLDEVRRLVRDFIVRRERENL